MSVTQNNIVFSNINTTDNITGYATKKTRTSFITNGKYDESKLSNAISAVENGNTTQDKIAFINAIDIDWNGVQIPIGNNNTTSPLNTTGEIINFIGLTYATAKDNSINKKSFPLKNGSMDYGSDSQILISTGQGTTRWEDFPTINSYSAGEGLELTSENLLLCVLA